MKRIKMIGFGLILVIATINYGLPDSSWAAPPAVNKRQAPPPILILDDDFRPGDWTASAETATGGATFTVNRQLTGGYGSPPFRFMSHRIPPVSSGLSTLVVSHIYLDDSYDPSVQGAISTLDYSEAGI